MTMEKSIALPITEAGSDVVANPNAADPGLPELVIPEWMLAMGGGTDRRASDPVSNPGAAAVNCQDPNWCVARPCVKNCT